MKLKNFSKQQKKALKKLGLWKQVKKRAKDRKAVHLLEAFTWSESEEGFLYWYTVHVESTNV